MRTPQAKTIGVLAAAPLLLLLLLLLSGVADAQLSVQTLIGDSVSEPGNARYSDVTEAITRFQNRDVFGAQKFLEDAREKSPKLPPVGVMMAKMHALTGNEAAVRPSLERSIDADPDDPEPYLLLGEVNLQANRTIEADALFEKSVKLIDQYESNATRKRRLKIRALRGRAAVAERRRKWTAAERDLRAWLNEDPENANALTRLGQVLCMQGRVDEGRQQFIKAKELQDGLSSPYVMTAIMLERVGRQSEAITEFTKAYREDRTNERTLVPFAQTLIRTGKLEQAGKVLAAARAAAPDSFNVWLLSGVQQRMAGNASAAEQSLQHALGLQPGAGGRDAYDQLAQLLCSQDEAAARQRGLQYALTGAKVAPDSADMKTTLAWAFYRNGRSREATQALRAGTQGTRLGADARVLVAKILIASNQPENARRLLTEALGETGGIFVQRKEAEELLASLN